MLKHRQLTFKGRAPAPGGCVSRWRVCRTPGASRSPLPEDVQTSVCAPVRSWPTHRLANKRDQHQCHAKRHLRNPAASRTAISGLRGLHSLRSPGGRLPVTRYTTERRLPRARPVVGQFQRPRLRFATVRAGVARPSLPPCARSVASLAQASTMPQHQPENSHVRHHFRPGHTRP